MWFYIAQGLVYGFAAAAQPGPLQTYIISQAIARGWRRALPTALAPLISDGPIIAICLFILSQIPIWFERFLHLAGGLFILFLAYGAYKSWKSYDTNMPPEESGTTQSVFKAALTNLLAPGAYLFWSFVTGPVLLQGWRQTPIYVFGFLASFYGAMILSLCAIILVFSMARHLGSKFNHTLLGISVIALFGFGLYQLWLGIKG